MTRPKARPIEIQMADSMAASLIVMTCAVRCTSEQVERRASTTMAPTSATHAQTGTSKLAKLSADALSAAARWAKRGEITKAPVGWCDGAHGGWQRTRGLTRAGRSTSGWRSAPRWAAARGRVLARRRRHGTLRRGRSQTGSGGCRHDGPRLLPDLGRRPPRRGRPGHVVRGGDREFERRVGPCADGSCGGRDREDPADDGHEDGEHHDDGRPATSGLIGVRGVAHRVSCPTLSVTHRGSRRRGR